MNAPDLHWPSMQILRCLKSLWQLQWPGFCLLNHSERIRRGTAGCCFPWPLSAAKYFNGLCLTCKNLSGLEAVAICNTMEVMLPTFNWNFHPLLSSIRQDTREHDRDKANFDDATANVNAMYVTQAWSPQAAPVVRKTFTSSWNVMSECWAAAGDWGANTWLHGNRGNMISSWNCFDFVMIYIDTCRSDNTTKMFFIYLRSSSLTIVNQWIWVRPLNCCC